MRDFPLLRTDWLLLAEREYIQSSEEGRDVGRLSMSAADIDWVQQRSDVGGLDTEQLQQIYFELLDLPLRSDFPYHEPTDWEAIVGACGEKPALPASWQPPRSLPADREYDKICGGWLGRSCGCTLGNPFPTGARGPHGESGYEILKEYLRGADCWPLASYLPGHSTYKGLQLRSPDSWAENIAFVEPDDDLQYTVIGLLAAEQWGYSICSTDLMKLWLKTLPFDSVSTAERRSYLTAAALCGVDKQREFSSEELSLMAHYRNPYREWIGAQIRADVWGYLNPGAPGAAAVMAYRDARISHTKNAVYAAMFMAALIAEAFVSQNAAAAIARALQFVPADSRVYQAVQTGLRLGCDCRTQEELITALHREFGSYHPVHSINNAAVVTAALVFGGDDFGQTIATAVLTGWDSDCNGASAGSVWGVLHGASEIPEQWKAPLNNTLYTDIAGFHPVQIDRCAQRTVDVIERARTSEDEGK